MGKLYARQNIYQAYADNEIRDWMTEWIEEEMRCYVTENDGTLFGNEIVLVGRRSDGLWEIERGESVFTDEKESEE